MARNLLQCLHKLCTCDGISETPRPTRFQIFFLSRRVLPVTTLGHLTIYRYQPKASQSEVRAVLGVWL